MEYTQFIAGEFRPGSADRHFEVLDPSTGQSLGRFAMATDADVDEAIAAAADAFQAWRGTSALERAALLRRVAERMRSGRQEIADRIARELGKPVGEGQKEVDTAAEMFEWAAEEARRLYGRVIPARADGMSQQVLLEPVGPVAGFAGWNAPAITPARKISGALAAGCTIVLKPSEETAGVALLIARAIQQAGIPDGVVNLVFGPPQAVADRLCDSPRIAMLTFTGATSVGKAIGARAAATLKRATLELGGHAPVIVCGDVDVERVARTGVAAKFRNAGQVCTSPTRFLVERSVFETFAATFAAGAKALKVGSPFDAATQMGPLKNARRREAVERLVDDARERGFEVAAGGRRIDGPGFFFAPTVLVHGGLSCEATDVEPFGPIALISPFDTLDQAIAEANRLPFGLAAYAHTNHLRSAQRLAQEIDSGAITINDWQASLPETPFGGHKDSGLGSEGGIEGLREFLKVKSVRMGFGT